MIISSFAFSLMHLCVKGLPHIPVFELVFFRSIGSLIISYFSLKKKRGDVFGKNKKVLIVGDVLHSRVARSNIHGLLAAGAKIVLSGPPTLIPPWLFNVPQNSEIFYQQDLDHAIQGVDVVMALRLQTERQASGMLPSIREYTRRWQVTEKRMGFANPAAIVMHPGPLNEGIEISSSLAHGKISTINEQVTNGVALRMALLYKILTFTPDGSEELTV